MKVTNKDYDKMTSNASPKSPKIKNFIIAYLVGGLICSFGQLLISLYEMAGLSEINAKTASTLSLILLAALATGLNLFNKLAKHAGAGTLVPITGFANSVVAPAIEFKSEGHVMGIGAKMFTIAGPVLVFGIGASVLYGLVIWIFKLF